MSANEGLLAEHDNDFSDSDFPILENQTAERAAEYFRMALQLLRKNKASTIPLNYALCYFYAAGSNLLFNEKMDQLLNNGSQWNHDTASRLFMRYFTPCSDASMAELQQELLVVVNEIVGSVLESAGRSQARTDRLDHQVKQLSQCRETRQAIAIASDILDEARQFASETRLLEGSLRESADQVTQLKEELLHARREALIDALTGLDNRRAFDDSLEKLMRHSIESSRRFSLIILDIDHFKSINDTHGHLVGDRVLRQIAKQLKSRTRNSDTVARYGGEEFAILLPDTGLQQALQTAEHIRMSIGQLNMRRTDSGIAIGRITASFGVGEYRSHETAQQFITRADDALYRAKNQHRDRVVAAQD